MMATEPVWRIGASRPHERPVLYVDVDDTLIVHARDGSRPAPQATAFLEWAVDAFDLRWLSYWAPAGVLDDRDLESLSRMLDMDARRLASVQGLGFGGTAASTKLDAVTWLEHLVLGRPFLWIEDDDCMISIPTILAVLSDLGLRDRWVPCNVTRTPHRLARIYDALQAGPTTFRAGERILDPHALQTAPGARTSNPTSTP